MSHSMADAPRTNQPIANSIQLPQVILPRRKIIKDTNSDGKHLFYVGEATRRADDGVFIYKLVSKGYPHSTSAFAALGRLTQKDTLASGM